jgi:hypothetical protein
MRGERVVSVEGAIKFAEEPFLGAQEMRLETGITMAGAVRLASVRYALLAAVKAAGGDCAEAARYVVDAALRDADPKRCAKHFVRDFRESLGIKPTRPTTRRKATA